MSFESLIVLLASICSILGYFIPGKFKSNRWFYVIFIFIMTIACGYIIQYNSELERIKNIHRQANAIYEHYHSFGNNKEYIQETLIFLEENKDRYPDAYKRAMQIYSDMKSSEFQYDSEPAAEMRGLLKGIATMNQE